MNRFWLAIGLFLHDHLETNVLVEIIVEMVKKGLWNMNYKNGI